MASDGMSRDDACELAGEMEDFLDIPAAVCESIERHLVDGDYECVCRYILGRRRAMADLIEPESDYATFELYADVEEVYPTSWWKCSKCGEKAIMMCDEGEPAACPYCGARNAKVD